jgi:hypothetical protein
MVKQLSDTDWKLRIVVGVSGVACVSNSSDSKGHGVGIRSDLYACVPDRKSKETGRGGDDVWTVGDRSECVWCL